MILLYDAICAYHSIKTENNLQIRAIPFKGNFYPYFQRSYDTVNDENKTVAYMDVTCISKKVL